MTLRNLIEKAFDMTGDDINAMTTTLSDEELDREFFNGEGHYIRKKFVVWGDRYIYFLTDEDGFDQIIFAPLEPRKTWLFNTI